MFDFNREQFEAISYKAMLNDDLKKIFEMKIKGCSITKIAIEMNMNEPSVNRRIKELKKKIKKVI